MSSTQLLLIDLSAIAHMIWHVSGNEPDPSFISTQIVARVRALATEHPHAAVCCDSGKSFRADIDPGYKAQRDTENRAPLRHQMDVACETLKRDGFPVWAVRGFEADDVIATATAEALKIDGATVLIASSDKDLLQLVNDRVSAKSLNDGGIKTPADVFDKFGVNPEQMGDLLALMGDKADNVEGAEGIGKVIGARLLSEHGTLAALYEEMEHGQATLTDRIRKSLLEFKPRWPTVASLIALRTDAPIPFHEIAVERTAPPMEDSMRTDIFDESGVVVGHQHDPERVPFEKGNDANDAPLPFKAPEPKQVHVIPEPERELTRDESRSAIQGAVQRLKDNSEKIGDLKARAPQPPIVMLSQPTDPVEFSQQLEPRTMPEAITLAKHMFESRLFSAYGTPQAVLATVLAGRELGIPAMASLRAFHVIEGRPTMSAGTIQSLVLKSKLAAYFRCSERTAERATFVTKRGDDPEMALTYTIEDGRQAWSKDDAAWKKSGWGRNPADMLVARAASKLARLVYPDVVSWLYAPEEME